MMRKGVGDVLFDIYFVIVCKYISHKLPSKNNSMVDLNVNGSYNSISDNRSTRSTYNLNPPSPLQPTPFSFWFTPVSLFVDPLMPLSPFRFTSSLSLGLTIHLFSSVTQMTLEVTFDLIWSPIWRVAGRILRYIYLGF